MSTSLKRNLDAIIFEKLKEELIAGRWKPGHQISIDDIASQYGVSRTPVIHALKMMSAEGIVNSRPNGRVEVPIFTPKQIVDICKMRLLLEDFALKTICENKNADVMPEIYAIARECETQTKVYNNMIEARKVDLMLHRQIVTASGSDCLLNGYIMIQGQFTTANHLFVTHTDAAHVISCDEHMQLLDYLNAFNYKAASKTLTAHIMAGCERILGQMDKAKTEAIR